MADYPERKRCALSCAAPFGIDGKRLGFGASTASSGLENTNIYQGFSLSGGCGIPWACIPGSS